MGMKNGKNNHGKKAAIVGIGLVLLIAFYNGVGYVGNAIADPKHSLMWWTIAGLVGVTVGVIEIKNVGGGKK